MFEGALKMEREDLDLLREQGQVTERDLEPDFLALMCVDKLAQRSGTAEELKHLDFCRLGSQKLCCAP